MVLILSSGSIHNVTDDGKSRMVFSSDMYGEIMWFKSIIVGVEPHKVNQLFVYANRVLYHLVIDDSSVSSRDQNMLDIGLEEPVDVHVIKSTAIITTRLGNHCVFTINEIVNGIRPGSIVLNTDDKWIIVSDYSIVDLGKLDNGDFVVENLIIRGVPDVRDCSWIRTISPRSLLMIANDAFTISEMDVEPPILSNPRVIHKVDSIIKYAIFRGDAIIILNNKYELIIISLPKVEKVKIRGVVDFILSGGDLYYLSYSDELSKSKMSDLLNQSFIKSWKSYLIGQPAEKICVLTGPGQFSKSESKFVSVKSARPML